MLFRDLLIESEAAFPLPDGSALHLRWGGGGGGGGNRLFNSVIFSPINAFASKQWETLASKVD